MEPTFRRSMDWLHTWAGVVLGGLLFAIFWMGTLAVFDYEIDRWMSPMLRLPTAERTVSFDALRPSLDAAADAKSAIWLVVPPSERQPMIRVSYRDRSGLLRQYLDPASGATLPDPATLAGSGFLNPFHYNLHIRLKQIGVWLVGLASMTMLVLCVSGIVIHRKVFADFFTFRPKKQPRRVVLDLHNVASVIGLPFHFAITLSGLIYFYSIYFPSSWQFSYPDRQTFSAEADGTYSRRKLNQPGKVASLDTMVEEAQRLWSGAAPRALAVWHPGDAAAYVSILRSKEDRVTYRGDIANFDAATGKLLHVSITPNSVMSAQGFIAGFHRIQFKHWTLRWLYFGLGLLGCVMIATGYLYWLDARRKKHAQLRLRGVPVVEGLTIGSVTGIVIATLAFFVVNRLLPLGTTFLGQERAALEVWTFYLVWLATFAHAWLRPGRAWIEQCWTIAAFAVSAALLNWITTGDHLIRSLSHRHLWPIAGMDLLLLAGAFLAALTARKLQHRTASNPGSRVPARVADP